MSQVDIPVVLPELILSVYAMAALIGAVYFGKDRLAPTLTWVTAAGMVLLALWIALTREGSLIGFGGMVQDDAFARFAKVTVLLSGGAVLAMSGAYMERRGILRFEYPVLIALASVGMMIMVRITETTGVSMRG